MPINERVQDLCYDFLPENGHAVQTGLPEDSKAKSQLTLLNQPWIFIALETCYFRLHRQRRG